jgi:hypothetical protein
MGPESKLIYITNTQPSSIGSDYHVDLELLDKGCVRHLCSCKFSGILMFVLFCLLRDSGEVGKSLDCRDATTSLYRPERRIGIDFGAEARLEH